MTYAEKYVNMEDIKVGEYVRSHDGLIFEASDYWINECLPNLPKEVKDKYKHSFNIIDLIEIGDYVNGYKLKDIRLWNTFFNGKHEYKLDFGELGTMKSGEIRSIVTHEQFENMKYVVGDE